MLRVCLLLLCFLVFYACDNWTTTQTNTPGDVPAAGTNEPRSAVQGFVVGAPPGARANVALVAEPGNLPRMAGVEVRLLSRPEGRLVATTRTDASGFFRFEGLNLTHVALEVGPDVRRNLTLVFGQTLSVGPPAISRQRALELVPAPRNCTVLCTQNLLPPGTRIRAALDRNAPVHVVGDRGEWLLLIDSEPWGWPWGIRFDMSS